MNNQPVLTEKALHDFLDELSDAVIIIDSSSYDILFVNTTAKNSLPGYDSGGKCYEQLQNSGQPCAWCRMSDLSLHDFVCHQHYSPCFSTEVKTKQRLVQYNDTTACLEICQMQPAGSNEMQTALQLLETEKTIVTCAKALATLTDMDLAINTVLKVIVEYYQADRSYIFEFDHEEHTASIIHEWCRRDIMPEKDSFQDIAAPKEWRAAFREHRSIFLSDIPNVPFAHDNSFMQKKLCSGRSVLTVPLFDKGKLMGFFGVDNPREKSKDCKVLKTLSRFMANAIAQMRIKNELQALCYIDSATSLFNSNRYLEDLKLLHKDGFCSIGIVFVDVNGLKEINDNHGHHAGDELLSQVASDLAVCFQGTAYRVGGDEFIVLCKDISRQDMESELDILQHLALNRGYSVSIGHAWAEQPARLEELVNLADQNMYENKKNYYMQQGKDRRQSPRESPRQSARQSLNESVV